MRAFTFKIRTVVLFFNLILIVIIVLAGIFITRWLTEARTIRQTELILISQGMVLSQVILDKMRADKGPDLSFYGKALEQGGYRPTLTKEEKESFIRDPVQPRLDPFFGRPLEIRDLWEKEEAPPADPLAAAVGRSVVPLLLAARESTLTGIRVVDWQGVVVGSTSGGQGRSLYHWPEVALALDGRLASRMYQRSLENVTSGRRAYRLHVALPLVHGQRCMGAVVLIREPLNVELGEFYRLRDYVVAGTAALLIVVIFFAGLTALTISLPIGALLKQTDRLAKGDPNSLKPLKRPVTQEIDRLSKGFVRMARTLEDRSNYILTFARELSHAFKPSLATIKLRLELLEEEEGGELSPEERKRHLDIIKEETARMDRKTNRALEWARADAHQPTGGVTDVNQAINEITDHYQNQNIQLGLDLGSKIKPAAIGPDDFEKIILNLVDNAIQHGGEQAVIQIKTRGMKAQGREQVEIWVADNGPGISQANRKKVFNTFFTTTPESGGSGLGLSIVRSLVKAHEGSITLESGPEFNTIFIVRLPVG